MCYKTSEDLTHNLNTFQIQKLPLGDPRPSPLQGPFTECF